MKAIKLETLAVMFRTNDPNLGHVSTLEAMTEAGLAYMYGHYRGIPQFHKLKRRKLRETIARELDRKAITERYQDAIDCARIAKETPSTI